MRGRKDRSIDRPELSAERGASERHIEAFLGHGPRKTAGRHYMLKIRERELRPIADDLEAMLRTGF